MRLILSLSASMLLLSCSASPEEADGSSLRQPDAVPSASSDRTQPAEWTAPLSPDRVTKKPFGIRIDPEHSPVSPERFRGYHTGTDFEMLPEESDGRDIRITAACEGTLIVKKWVEGYGGVAIQQCMLANEPVTVLYGHLRLSSVSGSIGDALSQGSQVGVLGSGYTHETDGERRHLHLSIHRGGTVELRGYVQSAAELDAWIDPETVLR